MPDPTPGGPTPTPNEEPRTGALFQVLVTGERDPTAIYTAMREVESMAGRSVVTQMSSEIAQLSCQIETVGSRLEARTRFGGQAVAPGLELPVHAAGDAGRAAPAHLTSPGGNTHL